MTSKERILVVDDDPIILKLLQKMLSRYGYNVVLASNVTEAIRIMETARVDLVITDHRMPRGSGIELIRHVRENVKDTGVIMITGHPTIEGAIHAVKSGAEEYLPKPVTIEELLTAVRAALEKRRLQRLEIGESCAVPAYPAGMIGSSEAMLNVYGEIARAAKSSATVLITGESGTGKELAARSIHYGGARKSFTFFPVNCGGIPENILDDELFGFVRDAVSPPSTTGLFHAAEGGTILLDGVENLSFSLQTKLLRVLEDKEMFTPSGPHTLDVRIIASTARDLHNLASAGVFRQDLYYRLNVITIRMPPLRERGDDIILLARNFSQKFYHETGTTDIPSFSEGLLGKFRSYGWPGNVRELENLVHHLIVMVERKQIDIPDLPAHMRYTAVGEDKTYKTLKEVEREHILNILAAVGGNKSQAAEILGVDRKTLRKKLMNYGMPSGAASE